MYEELVKRLRDSEHEIDCSLCDRDCCYPDGKVHGKCIIIEAADAIEELLKVASAMHTWIFLNTGDEQKAYDECGLSDEMNAALGYSGQFVAEPLKEET